MMSLVATDVGIDGRLKATNLAVPAGQLVAVIGPNGGGKTSLLRALARVEQAGGKVTVDGEDLDQAPEARRRQLLSFLPASRDVGWPIAARDVIALGLERPDPARMDELIELFELASLVDRAIDRLSTGERARVLMARAMAARPKVLLLDEPLSNLDPYWVLRFLDLLDQVRLDGTVVIVSLHDLAHLARFDRALLIDQNHLIADDNPEKLLNNSLFQQVFRIAIEDGRAALRPADRQSSR
jgi:iron complex transport system ATP-binding protein